MPSWQRYGVKLHRRTARRFRAEANRAERKGAHVLASTLRGWAAYHVSIANTVAAINQETQREEARRAAAWAGDEEGM